MPEDVVIQGVPPSAGVGSSFTFVQEDELEGDPAEDVGDVEQGLEVSPGEVGCDFSPELGREAAGRAFDVPQPRLRTRPFV